MAHLLTFGEAQQANELAEVSGLCSSSDNFKSLLNQATRQLMRRGNWFGTVQTIRVCSWENCITWPRRIGALLAIKSCGRNIPVDNLWYSFLPTQRGDWNWDGVLTASRSGNCWGNPQFVSDGWTPVMRNVPCGQSFYIRAYTDAYQDFKDVVKTITIFGVDQNGQVVRQTDSSGNIQDGITLTLNSPFVTTPMKFQRIDRVLKDQTQGNIRLYFYDSVNNVLLDCATYEPTETSPWYVHSKLVAGRRFPLTGSCAQPTPVNPVPLQVEALVKLEFVPVVASSDLVCINNLDALAMMMQAIRNKQMGQQDLAQSLELDAIRELNYSLRDNFPIEQFQVSFNPYGTARLQKQSIGSLI